MIVPYNLCVSIFINLYLSLIQVYCAISIFINSLVLSFWQNSIWNGGATNRALKKMFSSSAEERVDKKNLVTHFDHFRHLEISFLFFYFLIWIVLFFFNSDYVCNI